MQILSATGGFTNSQQRCKNDLHLFKEILNSNSKKTGIFNEKQRVHISKSF